MYRYIRITVHILRSMTFCQWKWLLFFTVFSLCHACFNYFAVTSFTDAKYLIAVKNRIRCQKHILIYATSSINSCKNSSSNWWSGWTCQIGMFDRIGNKVGYLHSISSTDYLKAIFIYRSYSSFTLCNKEFN